MSINAPSFHRYLTVVNTVALQEHNIRFCIFNADMLKAVFPI